MSVPLAFAETTVYGVKLSKPTCAITKATVTTMRKSTTRTITSIDYGTGNVWHNGTAGRLMLAMK